MKPGAHFLSVNQLIFIQRKKPSRGIVFIVSLTPNKTAPPSKKNTFFISFPATHYF